uniref:Ubiquitin carboxyl-terminal hydrolase 32 n=1 Tax=Eptatretus burgeri TaxID=7764 RepID=A0A8C4R9Q7_EPTBU
MGAKESKLGFLTYEDAIKRVTDEELKRLRDAFKRSCGLTSMSQQIFVREVLGDGVPPKVAEVIFNSFGGSGKGLTFKELMVGLVLLTRGRDEEKLKYIFSVCANDSGSYVTREGMEALLQACDGQPIPVSMKQFLREGERVSYDHFRPWLLLNKDLLIFSRWLLAGAVTVTLTNDNDTPTFYQTLAGVTHLAEVDIIDLEKRYWLLKAQSRTGRFDLDTFAPLLSPPLPPTIAEGVFNAFDENRDNHIDFKEISCGLSACCRGPLAERQKFCFKVFDRDHDGMLSRVELLAMAEILLLVWKETHPDTATDHGLNADAVVDSIFKTCNANKEDVLTLEDYQIWSVSNALANEFLKLLFQVCHIVLGLRPGTPQEEGQIIRGWLERECRLGFRPGQLWYMLSASWWQQWKDYVRYDAKPVVNEPVSILAGARVRALPRVCENGDVSGRTSPPSSLDSVSLASEASESTGLPLTPATENCFLGHGHSLSPDGTVRCFGTALSVVSLTSPSPPPAPQRPGVIDNMPLIQQDNTKVLSLTAEGGRLKRNPPLHRGRDYEIVPDPVWRSLSHWYGYNLILPRTVIPAPSMHLELYPVCVHLFRHQQPLSTSRPVQPSMFGVLSQGSAPPRRYLAYTACFSCMLSIGQIHDFLSQRLRLRPEDLRLWLCRDENLTLLDDEEQTVKSLNLEDGQQILIEVRNKDMSWPEEMSSLANRNKLERSKQGPTEKGATGLSNLGNTCFMNSSIQCVSNTRPLTQYFLSGMHLFELNRSNPLGMKGHMAKCYGDLIGELWSGTQKNVAPLKLRWTIGKYAPRFNGFQQQDSQELLAFLLDGLHEDLNRVHDKPYVELEDSDGRPDHDVAAEAWENHLLRNRSIVVDLFHGQLKSQVRCKTCGHVSVRFDPFNFLSLPLPMERSMHLEITVIRLDGSIPVRYGLRLGMEERYSSLKLQLSRLCGLEPEQVLLAEVFSSNIRVSHLPLFPPRFCFFFFFLSCLIIIQSLMTPPSFSLPFPWQNFPEDNQKVRSAAMSYLCAFEVPMPADGSPVTVQPLDATSEDSLLSVGLEDIIVEDPSKDGSMRKVKSDSFVANGVAGGAMPHTIIVKSASNGLPAEGSNAVSHDRLPEQQVLGQASGFVIALHRKMIRMEVYFLSSQKNRPSLFGMPLVIPCDSHTLQRDLYDNVWAQVERLVSPLPPQEASNHALDCDDSMGYQYPFTLSAVQRDGVNCAWCPWYRFCRGCKIECEHVPFSCNGAFLAVDWDPTALHLRYQTAQERVCMEHLSVEVSQRSQSEPINLHSCLRAFTTEEHLGEDELYYCSKCRTHRLASKKLDIWRLPPILIIHLKRFQFVNGRWIKSHKIVKFPQQCFEPTAFLTNKESGVSVLPSFSVQDPDASTEPVTSSASSDSGFTSNFRVLSTSGFMGGASCGSGNVSPCHSRGPSPVSSPRTPTRAHRRFKQLGGSVKRPCHMRREVKLASRSDERLDVQAGQNGGAVVSSSSTAARQQNDSNVMETRDSRENLDRFSNCFSRKEDPSALEHQQACENTEGRDVDCKNCTSLDICRENTTPSWTGEDDDCKRLRPIYDLCAISCHAGIMGGGHYVTYARNPNAKWYCYNDSSCKEVRPEEIDVDSAYLLFYERRGLDPSQFLPPCKDRRPVDTSSMDEDFESDYKKYCVIQ